MLKKLLILHAIAFLVFSCKSGHGLKTNKASNRNSSSKASNRNSSSKASNRNSSSKASNRNSSSKASNENSSSKGSAGIQQAKKSLKIPKNAKEALNSIIPVLHAPYNKGDYLIKLIMKKQAAVVKKGIDAQGGIGSQLGSGTYTLAVGKGVKPTADTRDAKKGYAKVGTIEYKYNKYQPKGFGIVLDGTLSCTEWHQGNGGDNNEYMKFKGDFDNTLKITGDFEAELRFVGNYGSTAHTMINVMVNGGDLAGGDLAGGDLAGGGLAGGGLAGEDKYMDMLISSLTPSKNAISLAAAVAAAGGGGGLVVEGTNARIELKYKEEVLTLNEELMKKLLKVS